MLDSVYFKSYRAQLGFSRQQDTKKFLDAKDITPTIDYNYIDLLNSRLIDIFYRIDNVVCPKIKSNDIEFFCQKNILDSFEKIKQNDIIAKLNNQGRRPEKVYFSWLRGFVVTKYFLGAISYIFDVDCDSIQFVGDDNFDNLHSFKRTPKADLQLNYKNEVLRIEIQSGFQDINDIKEHKVREAKNIKYEQDISSVLIHFDLYNGQVAFIRLDDIENDSVHWVTRQQMEGQTVFNINQNYFVWKLTQLPPKYYELEL
ncbi:hypothetical protein M2R47_01260 [Moraxella sp. Tifton1]|uniref:hypothetical protein n=1 Tax=Moraxella oculi TaxID=2940516 RepID=UPI002013323D|nr:hypothetical protein [Moraxella sp. Tifton1]MCL1622884.1 hypothetical protein [Moraxella sp. Tifton1]